MVRGFSSPCFWQDGDPKPLKILLNFSVDSVADRDVPTFKKIQFPLSVPDVLE